MEQLTSEQIAKVIQMIDAFQNGKRLNELPNIGNANPFDLIVEVLDTSGESHQAKLAALLPYIEEQCAYGIEWDTAISSPLCTRIGNLSLHRSLPIQNRQKGCLLDDNGQVVEYLSPNNWLAHDRSGTRGQVMVEIPTHYRKFETDGTKRRAMISEYPLPGYHFVKKQYVSSYEASWEWSTGKLCSVVNMSEDYRGGNNNAAWDNTHRSLLGRPVTDKNCTQFRNAARLRGAGTQWNELVYNTHKAYTYLFLIEYANRNSQAPFNAQPDANGYKQGGLGNGVTELFDWIDFNGYYPFVPCGHSDELGNASGEVACQVDFTGDGSDLRTVYVPRYRGIENPFGHIWKWTDGINIDVKTDADGGTSRVYVADDPANFNDSNYNGYTMRGLEARESGFTKEMIFGEFGDIIPAVVGGGSSSFWCDYHWNYIEANFRAGVRFGAGADYGSGAGLGSVDSFVAPSSSYANVGSRLCFLPTI
jgi:hypothetical protein